MAETTQKQQNDKKKHGKLFAWIGGDVLDSGFMRRQARLLVLIMVLVIFYINNRYECQKQLIEIDRLEKELTDVKYDALTRKSELMERSRQSKIEEFIKKTDSELQIATNPPYLIK